MVGRQPSPLAGAPDRRADCVISATLRIVLRRRQELQTATRVAPITLCVALRACMCAAPVCGATAARAQRGRWEISQAGHGPERCL